MRQLSWYNFIVLLAVAVVSLHPSLRAENELNISEPSVNLEGSGIQPAPEQREIIQARQLMRRQMWQPASALLEVAYEKSPVDPVIYNLLRTCYMQLGYHTKAELLVNRMINHFPNSFIYYKDLGEVLALEGKHDLARDAYMQAIDLVRAVNPKYTSGIVDNMIENHLQDVALEVIDSERQRSGDSTAYAIQRGSIFENERDYVDAAQEFLSVIDDTSGMSINAEKKLVNLLEFEESRDVVEPLMRTRADSSGSEVLSRVLANFYLQMGEYSRAFEYAIAQDSLGGYKGRFLLRHMRTCHDRELYAQSLEMGKYILNKYPDAPFVGEAYHIYADALRGLYRYDDALAMYDTMFTILTQPRDQAEILYRMGSLYLQDLNRPGKALVYFDSIITNYQLGYGLIMARTMIPFCYLRQGDLQQARSRFVSLQSSQLNQEQAEMVAYNLAMIDFYKKNVDSAKVELRRLINDYPRGFYVNDALELLAIIGDAEEAPDLLYDYSNALFFQEMRQYDSSSVKLLALVSAENPALADVALFQLAKMSLKQADSTVATIYVERLEREHPESYYLPYALRIKADMLMPVAATRGEALQIYRALLQKYPDYPFISEVRKILRHVDEEGQIG
jgi:tetratricopeptide (TPR) repeat protein